jgi:hypothetical protein
MALKVLEMAKKKKRKSKRPYKSTVYGAIVNKIRLMFLFSPNRKEALERAKIFEDYQLKSGVVKQRCIGYMCERCGCICAVGKEVNVHHIMPVGGLQNYPTLDAYIDAMLCEPDNLKVLCLECHALTHAELKGEKIYEEGDSSN